MNETQTKKYNKLISNANMKLDTLTFEEKEELYKLYNKEENRTTKLQKEFEKLAKDVENAIIELQVLQFLETGEIGDAQDVEYN